jgi:hypothetical protein
MKEPTSNERHFQVVKFIDQWPGGRTRQILGNDLSWDEALDLANDKADWIESEAVVIEDQNAPGVMFNVKSVGEGARRREGFPGPDEDLY